MNQSIAGSQRLAEQFELDVVPLRFAESVEDLGRPSLKKLWRAALVAFELLKKTLLTRPHAAYSTMSLNGGAFYRDCIYNGLLKLAGIPRAIHIHGKSLHMTCIEQRLFTWVARRACVIHLSPRIVGRGAMQPTGRIAFVGNGIADRAGNVPLDREGAVPHILYLSNFIEEKGPLVLLEALGRLRAKGMNFRASFAGSPIHKVVEKWKRRRTQLDLDNLVDYVGPVYGKQKDDLFAQTDIFVLPTFYEREIFPLVILEAMQWRIPVISTFEGAIPDLIDDGSTGFLVPSRDPEAIAERLMELISNPKRRREMGMRARDRFLDQFTLERFEDNLARVLHDVVHQG